MVAFFFLQKTEILRYMGMIYVTTQYEPEIKLLPRKTMFSFAVAYYTFELLNETTKAILTDDLINIYEISDVFFATLKGAQLDENTFYEITIVSTLEQIIYKDRIFCTDQNIPDLTINDGNYISAQTNNNDYITI